MIELTVDEVVADIKRRRIAARTDELLVAEIERLRRELVARDARILSAQALIRSLQTNSDQ